MERNPRKISGAWAFAGTRIPLYALHQNLAAGATVADFVEWFPDVSERQVRAVRELVANMLVHQDLAVTGAGPMVEIFADRIESSNPGKSLVAPDRLIDAPPRTRNEAIAAIMRRVGICEERGSGIDKAMLAIERAQLPAPRFETPPEATRVTVFARFISIRASATSWARRRPTQPCASGSVSQVPTPPSSPASSATR